MVFIKSENISFEYPSGNGDTFTLKNINFEINQGEFISILGPNGSGKTTLVKLLVKLLTPQKGGLFLLNKNFSSYSGKDFFKYLSYVPQKFSSVFPFTVMEIVLMGRTPHLNLLGYEKEEDIHIVEDILSQFNILHLKNKTINQISGGEFQRVIIARAIVQDTKMIILDEPNSHLDIKNQQFIFKTLKELNKKGKTILTISHDINLSAKFSDRIILMKDGKIFFDGSTGEALNETLLGDVFGINIKVLESNIGIEKTRYVVNA